MDVLVFDLVVLWNYGFMDLWIYGFMDLWKAILKDNLYTDIISLL